jgi:hypothetical protein
MERTSGEGREERKEVEKENENEKQKQRQRQKQKEYGKKDLAPLICGRKVGKFFLVR